jgi:hypothetical protein
MIRRPLPPPPPVPSWARTRPAAQAMTVPQLPTLPDWPLYVFGAMALIPIVAFTAIGLAEKRRPSPRTY